MKYLTSDSTGVRGGDWIALRIPVIVLIFAATAIPVEIRSQGPATLGFTIQVSDVAANILGYVPIGIVLGGVAPIRALITAALISTIAESSQFVMMHRDPSFVDAAANVIGSIVGMVISAFLGIRSPAFERNRWTATAAAVLAAALVLAIRGTAGDALNPRGVTAPGTIEAAWTFDEEGDRAADSSGHGLQGTFIHNPERAAGVRGASVKLDGVQDHIEVGQSTAFRIVGSMTITAWIKAARHPVDDAPIVSTLRDCRWGTCGGFQLDTTIDGGPRTIGFKLYDVCENAVAVTGATPLALDTWYHVAGVYDARAQTMTVYLNGEIDNGKQNRPVSSSIRSARGPLQIGRRPTPPRHQEFLFAGLLDDVRIYSRALSQAEVVAAMRGAAVDVATSTQTTSSVDHAPHRDHLESPFTGCDWSSELEDARLPGAVALLGVLVAVACSGLRMSIRPILCLIASGLAGLLLLSVATPTLPPLNLWMFPLTSLAGGAAVVSSFRVD